MFCVIHAVEILEELIEKTMKNLHAKVTVLCETLHTCINNNQEVSEIYKPLKVCSFLCG